MLVKLRWIVVAAFFLVGAILSGVSLGGAGSDGGILRVVFLDVGQGDAIFITSPSGTQVLVDTGPDRSVLRGVGRELGFWDRTIDVVVATHEDQDHIGGLSDIFERYDIALFLRTENQGTNAAADEVDRVAAAEGSDIVFARAGMELDLGGGVVLRVLFPDRDPTLLEANTSSIILRLSYGEIDFLLTGDAPSSIEDHLVVSGAILESEVLKAGHHGSRTSSGELFVQAVMPQYTVVSAGRDNRYGHPHPDVISVFEKYGVEVLSTAASGDVIFETDGRELWVE